MHHPTDRTTHISHGALAGMKNVSDNPSYQHSYHRAMSRSERESKKETEIEKERKRGRELGFFGDNYKIRVKLCDSKETCNLPKQTF